MSHFQVNLLHISMLIIYLNVNKAFIIRCKTVCQVKLNRAFSMARADIAGA